MKPGIIAALFVSVILVGGATWKRIDGNSKERNNPLILEQIESEEAFYREVFINPLENREESGEIIALTTTDLIGRQLIMDFVDLSVSGRASNENVTILAEKYAENIPNLINPPTISLIDIKTTTNSWQNIKRYSAELEIIYYSHNREIERIFAGQITGGGNLEFLFAKDASIAYDNIVYKLRNVSAPLQLAELHLSLINNYLSAASAMRALMESQDDPMLTMAGLIIFNESINRELSIITEIDKIFKANGI